MSLFARLGSIRARMVLCAVVATTCALTLAGFNVVSNRLSAEALGTVFDQSVRTLVQLQKIDASLREVRFRVAGVLLEIMPVQGSLNHLREMRKEVAQNWTSARELLGQAEDAEQASLRDAVGKNFARVDQVLGKIEQAYVAKDKAKLTEVLEDDWAALHGSFIKPLQALIPAEEASARLTYEKALARNAWMTKAAITLAVVLTLVMAGFVTWTFRGVSRSLACAGAGIRRIAAGDLSHAMQGCGDDEIGRLVRQVDEMQHSLRQVVGEVRSGVDSVDLASREIARGNLDLSARTEQQASSLQQTAASMEQMTSTLRQSADHARQASQLAASASEVAHRGGELVAQVVTTMEEITASSRRVSDIIGVIDGIAFQTNILALNAAVEAARAGEQGRGFAVVAGEVRSLAQRSATAAREIKSLIAGSTEKVDAGGRLVGSAGQTMDEIVAQVRRVAELIGEISSATHEQSQGVGQVNQAVTQLDQMTQQNAALVEQSTAAAESLKAQAARLSDAVAVFRLAPEAAAAEAPALA